jgi:MFS family permease
MEPYLWIVLLHIVGAFVFVLSHGVSAWMTMLLRGERDRNRIAALLDLSTASIGGSYVGLVLLLIGGIWAGIYGGHFGRGWIWAALGLLVVITVVMYAVATPYFLRLRAAAGIGGRGNPPDPALVAGDEELANLAARAPAAVLLGVGFGGLLLILWLMVLKPF